MTEQTDEEKDRLLRGKIWEAQREGKAPFLWKKLPPGLLSDDEQQKIREGIGGRVTYHIARLISPERSSAENNFASAYILYSSQHLKRIEEESRSDYRRIRDTLGGESSDTCMWWTLSPYVFQELSTKVGDEAAIEKLLEWAKDGMSFDVKLHLKGLEHYNDVAMGDPVFILSKNSEGFSHKFAEEEAKRLVEEVFKPNQ